jgi:hypothetical protein
MWTKFRKRYVLPIRWARKRMKEIEQMGIRSREEIYDKLKVESDIKMEMLRRNRLKESDIQEGKIQILKWLIYGEPEVQDNK